MLFTPENRKESLNKITNFLKKIDSVEGIILVGSCSSDNPDQWADIDLSIVINPKEKTRQVQKKFTSFAQKNFDLFHFNESKYEEDNYLSLFFLKNYLEIDIGFISFEKIFAKRKKWKILYEKSNIVSKKMQQTWENRETIKPDKLLKDKIPSVLYHLRNISVAIKRKKLFRAVKEIEDFRNLCVSLWGNYKKLDVKHFRDADLFDDHFKKLLLKTYPKEISIDELTSALKNSLNLYFYISNQVFGNTKEVQKLKQHLKGMLLAFGV